MRVHPLYYTLIGAALILLAFTSVSEARWFRGGYRYYYVPAYSAGCAPTNQASSVPAGGAPAASSGATAYQVNKIPIAAEQPLPAHPSTINNAPKYVPGAASGGSSVLPRSSWDYGRFPPFH
jgi:predicted lipid-binding transport protein (Tim44 family)